MPHREQLATALLVASLVAVGAFAWVLQLRPELQVESSQLRTLPERIDGWHGSSIPVEKTVESILRADANLQRIYQHRLSSEIIWLYVGYYGTTRGGRPEHTPRGCYTGAGWAIVTSRTLPMAGTDGLRVNEVRVARRHI